MAELDGEAIERLLRSLLDERNELRAEVERLRGQMARVEALFDYYRESQGISKSALRAALAEPEAKS